MLQASSMNWAVRENYLSGQIGYLLMESQREIFPSLGFAVTQFLQHS
jgi:hypothetical protein